MPLQPASPVRTPAWFSPRVQIFFVAFLFKSLFAALFFGSIDFIVSLGQTTSTISGDQFSVPYFPVISLYLLLSSALSAYTPIPLALCFKLVPILFSGLTAVLIFDILQIKHPASAYKAALLFALAPTTLLIDSFHFQWDSIVLYFLILAYYLRDQFVPSFRSYFWFGMSFAAAFMVKPYSLMFLPFFCAPLRRFPGSWRDYFRLHFAAGFGMLICVALGMLLLYFQGYDLLDRAKFILEYGNGGITIFGLPFAEPFTQYAFLKKRFVVFAAMGVLAIPYYFGVLGAFEVLGISFGLCLALLGLAPQYLVWIVPFLLLLGLLRCCALYVSVSTVFLVLYYAHPQASFMHHENMSTLAPLKLASWLTPSEFFYNPFLLPAIKIIGNYLVPFGAMVAVLGLCYAAFTAQLRSSGSVSEPQFFAPRGEEYRMRTWFTVFGFGPFILGAIIWFVRNGINLGPLYGLSVSAKTAQYQMVPYAENNYFFVPLAQFASVFNVVNILLVITVLWSYLAWSGQQKAKSERMVRGI